MIFFDLCASYPSWRDSLSAWAMDDGKETHQQEGKDDAAHEEPLSSLEWNEEAALGDFALCKDFVCPFVGGQHGNGGEDIEDVDQE